MPEIRSGIRDIGKGFRKHVTPWAGTKSGAEAAWRGAGKTVLRPWVAGQEGELPKLELKPPTEQLRMPNPELAGATEAAKKRFVETQTVGTKLVHEQINEAVKADTKAHEENNTTELNRQAGDPKHKLLLTLNTIDRLSERSDGNFSADQQVSFLKRDRSPNGNPIVITDEHGVKLRVNSVIGKDGDGLRCEMTVLDTAGNPTGTEKTDLVSTAQVVRGQILAEETIAQSLFTGNDAAVFGNYIQGVKGGPNALVPFELSGEAITKFDDQIQQAGKDHVILTRDDAKRAAIIRSGYEGPEAGPEANATDATKKAWEKLQSLNEKLKIDELEATHTNLIGPETFQVLFDEDNSATIDALRARAAATAQDVQLNIAPPAALQADRDRLAAAQVVQKNSNVIQEYFNGSQTGSIPREASVAIRQAFLTGKTDSFAGDVMPEIKKHDESVAKHKDDREKLVKRKARNRKATFGTLAGLAALGYFISSRFTDDE